MIQKTTSSRITKFSFCLVSVLILFPIYSFKAISQNNTYEETIPFEQADVVPLFKGCDENSSRKETIECFYKKMINHIQRNFTYPEEALNNKIQGRVDVSFIINQSGKVEDIIAKASNQKDFERKILEDEAIRIISLLPKFTPGMHKGQVVNIKYGLPITFKTS